MDNLKVEHVNARSLLSCFDEIKLLIVDRNIDILCITETWLVPNVPNRLVNIQGYKLFRCDGGQGGGSCIYIRNSLSCVQVKVDLPICEGIQDVWVKVQLRKLPSFIVGAMYRHPHALVDSFDYVYDILQLLSLEKKNIFLLGDLNDDQLACQSKLRKIVNNLNFYQIIDEPTRITSTTKTLLDVLITNNREIIVHSEVASCHLSDHELISVDIDVRKPKKKLNVKTFRSLKNYSQENFCNSLLNCTVTLNKIFETDDVNKQVRILTSTFVECLNSCAPIVTQTITRPPAPWMTEEIRKEMGKRNRLKQQLVNNHNEATYDIYKTSKKHVKILIKSAKVNHYRDKFDECKVNKNNIWKIINDIVPSKGKDGHDINVNNPIECADNFNNFFANVGRNVFEETQRSENSRARNLNSHFPLSMENRPFIWHRKFRPQPVTVLTVIDIVKNLKNKNSSGADGISSRFLKDSLPVIAFYLTIIINTSIVTGIVPSEWKFAIVCPAFKQGDNEDPSNYRPISLLPILSKVLEKIVANQLHEYMSTNELFSNSQHGFRKLLSTQTALTQIMENLYRNVDNNEISLLALCDLSKAFDSVSHSILLTKMKSIHIDDFWFKDYLTNRTQAVKVNSHISSKMSIEYGVPQGSVLGPILFNIFINDLQDVANDSIAVQFADDAQFLHSQKIENLATLVRQMECTMERVNKYFTENGLKVNSSKTQFIFIGSRQYIDRLPKDLTLKVGSSHLNVNSSVKNLGLVMDNYLSFDKHIENLCNRANGLLFFLNRNKELFDNHSRKIVVESLIISLFSYCSVLWGATSKSSLTKLQKIQNFAAKVAVGNGRKFERATPFIKKLHWLKVNEQLKYDVLIFIFKVYHGKLPNWVLNINQVGNTQVIWTRQSNDLLVPRTRTKLADRALSVRGPVLWNDLPEDIKILNSLPNFKRELRKYMQRF